MSKVLHIVYEIHAVQLYNCFTDRKFSFIKGGCRFKSEITEVDILNI